MSTWSDDEIDSLFDVGAAGTAEPSAVTALLAQVRAELLQPVPAEVEARHLDAMLAVAPAPRRRARVDTRRARVHTRRARRALALVACAGATFTYGGLAAAGALPAPTAVPHRVVQLFTHDAPTPPPPVPATTVVVPGTDEQRVERSMHHDRSDVPPALSTPGDSARPATTTTTDAPAATPADDDGPGASNGRGDGAGDGAVVTPPGQTITTPADGATAPGQGGTPPGQSIAPGRNDATPAAGNANEHTNEHVGDNGNDNASDGDGNGHAGNASSATPDEENA